MTKEERRRYNRLHYEKNKEKRAIQRKIWYSNNVEYKSNLSKSHRLKVKLECIGHYGGCCGCCGESILAFLAIDHMNGGGTQHRKSEKISGSRFYSWLKKNNFPDGFQVLCHNCNWAKYVLGECPHKNNATESE